MWTNVFRIGELQAVSWFQFFPYESDANTLPDRSLKAEQRDASTSLVLSAHLQLQNDGFLSTWTNSFVGPWDPSQGVHNPDEKVKLWLFLPGRNASLSEAARVAVSKLRVLTSGLWVAPGDSEEVGIALSQSLRNAIERALRGLSYFRFGDTFMKCHPVIPVNRGLQPMVEFIFAATDEAIYVYSRVSAKHIRGLDSNDMERLLWRCSSHLNGDGIPVIVAPNGMRGRITGCYSSDIVKQVYGRKLKDSNNAVIGSTYAIQCSDGHIKGKTYYVEVTLGCHSSFDSILGSECKKNNFASHVPNGDSQPKFSGRAEQKLAADQLPLLERTLIFPSEAVVIPVIHKSYAQSSTKSFRLQKMVKKSWSQMWSLWNFADSSPPEFCLALGNACSVDPFILHGADRSDARLQRQYKSSSSSVNSSISSISRTSNESDHAVGAEGGDLEADADSLTCRKSGLFSSDQYQNDGNRKVSKRTRAEASGQAGTVINETVQDVYMSDYSGVEANGLAAAGARQAGLQWDWDDDDRTIGVDIQILLSEFGDFSDFFEDDMLTFGEPPGTAESQALVFLSTDYGDASGSPFNCGIDVPEQNFTPVGLGSLEGFNDQIMTPVEDTRNKSTELPSDSRPSFTVSTPSVSMFSNLTKAEAMMTFAPEYAPVDTSSSEIPTKIFSIPYLPRPRKSEVSDSISSTYVYNATPPSLQTMEEKSGTVTKLKVSMLGHDWTSLTQPSKSYSHVHGGVEKKNNVSSDNEGLNGVLTSVSGMKSSLGGSASLQNNDSILDPGSSLLCMETVLATDIECAMLQASMCRVRHTLLSLKSKVSICSTNTAPDIVYGDTGTKSGVVAIKHEIRRKDNIPVRIAGDIDGGIQDGSLTAQLGVWLPVGAPKDTKSSRFPENFSILPFDSNENIGERVAQRQPLYDLLDALVFLVQQAASFVDISLDSNDCDGPFCWLAKEEQQRREFACGPSMIHAGCGGLLSTCHSLDIAGVDLNDPLSAEVQPSSVISLLHSDIKTSLKSAFGSLDGPLSVVDWCKGRSNLSELGSTGDTNDARDSLSTVTVGGEPISPSQSTGGSSNSRADGPRVDELSQRRLSMEIYSSDSEQQKGYSRLRPTVMMLPLPSILVGYQDDWLKASVNVLDLWEKASLDPYSSLKPVNYYAVCPDVDLLTSAAGDFFQQLGAVYELCKLGSHSPYSGVLKEPTMGMTLPSGLVLVNCPQPVKVSINESKIFNKIGGYFAAISESWNMKDFLKSVTKVVKDLKLISSSSINQKESSSGPTMVIYIVCPFPGPEAVLQTLIECSSALGSVIFSSDKERRSLLCSQVSRALNCTSSDEASPSSVLMLSGFSVPKIVLQIIPVETLLRINRPTSEAAFMKDIAFTVYNKVRRISRTASNAEIFHSSSYPGRSHSNLMHVGSPIPGLWKDTIGGRMPGQAEPDMALRAGNWDNSWQTSRVGNLSCDQTRLVDVCGQDDARYMFEPLFILAESGSVEHGLSLATHGNVESSNSKSVDDSGGIYMQTSTLGGTDTGTTLQPDGTDQEPKPPSLHCAYGWTEDWRWLICIWTDSKGELLDSCIFPFGGISSRQDTKVLQSLFVQILQQGCHILSCSYDAGSLKPRDVIITRIGSFFELECQEWQKAIYFYGGNDIRKWPLQLRRTIPDGITASTNGNSLQQHDLALVQDRNLPSSPSPSLYSPHSKASFVKGGMGQSNSKKQLLAGQTAVDSSRGSLQLVQSISLVGVSLDHALHLFAQADISSYGGTLQSSSNPTINSLVEGSSPLKSLGSIQTSYLLVPSANMRYISPAPLQLPTCLTLESPPLAHLLHSKGSAIPLATGYVVSKAVPTLRQSSGELSRDDWPSVLAVTLIDHYGSNSNNIQERMARGTNTNVVKQVKNLFSDVVNNDYEVEARMVLETIAAEMHSLSWMTISPNYPERRTALPFHCDSLLRLRRLLHFADKEFSRPPEQRL